VAWFDTITTLHDFCGQTLLPRMSWHTVHIGGVRSSSLLARYQLRITPYTTTNKRLTD
jgi:hypothetical protein